MILRTERLILREILTTDWPAVLEYQSDPRYLRYYSWQNRRESDVRALVDTFVSWQYEAPRSKYQLAITLAAEDMLVGNCGIRLPSADAEQGELGYELAPNHWGQGYATEAARAMLDFAFGELDLHRLWASCLAENRGSVRVLERLGLRREGTLLQSQWVKGRWRDTYLYAILQEEHNR